VLDISARFFLSNLNFLNRVPQKFSVYNFTEIRPVGTLMIRVNGHDEANKRLSRLCEGDLKGSQVVDLILRFITTLTKSEIYTREANKTLEHKILRDSDKTANHHHLLLLLLLLLLQSALQLSVVLACFTISFQSSIFTLLSPASHFHLL
jgi:hypothetical protein